MIESRILDVTPSAIETHHYDDVEDVFHIETVEDVEPLMDHNKWLSNNTPGSWKGDGFHRIATIPATVLAELRQKGILKDMARFRAWLNERDNQVFRTRRGRV